MGCPPRLRCRGRRGGENRGLELFSLHLVSEFPKPRAPLGECGGECLCKKRPGASVIPLLSSPSCFSLFASITSRNTYEVRESLIRSVSELPRFTYLNDVPRGPNQEYKATVRVRPIIQRLTQTVQQKYGNTYPLYYVLLRQES